MKFNGSIKKIFVLSIFLFISDCKADQDLITLFPLTNYNQNIDDWVKPSTPNYDTRLITQAVQLQYINKFYNHYFGIFSPWNAEYVNQLLHQSSPYDIKSLELKLLSDFSNVNKSTNKIGYGENFRPYGIQWSHQLNQVMNLEQFANVNYQEQNRGITVNNVNARVLPTDDVYFYDAKLAGEGYPFDNLQVSAIWAGTPVYIIGQTTDAAWSLVLTPDFIAWIDSNSIGKVDNQFITTWQTAAKQHLAAIIRTKTHIVDDLGQFRFSAYVGSVFPMQTNSLPGKIMIPVVNGRKQAVIQHALVNTEQAAIMPMPATPHQFIQIMKTLLGRPYGWGNMYFYNDCSAELKSLYTPFGIWLPRHSSEQVSVGQLQDLSSATLQHRLDFLTQKGHPFTTIVYIGGHIFMFIGSYPNIFNNDNKRMAMTYQNVWGLKPDPANRRAVIGQSVLLPLLTRFQEDPNLKSQASNSYFQVSFLDKPTHNLFQLNHIDLQSLIYLKD